MSGTEGTDTPPVYSRASSPTGSSISNFEVDDVAPRYSDAPRYSSVFPVHGRPIRGTRASHPLTTEHNFNLERNDIPWVKLAFTSRASSALDPPKLEGGDHIAGTLILDLDSPMAISDITISVKGFFITAGTEEGSYTFLDKSYTVWSKAMGDPRYASDSSTQSAKYRGNLDAGEYTWPFSIPFPSNFDYGSTPAATKSYRIPQSFLERGAPATVQYKVLLNIRRGILRSDKNITVPVVYTPRIVPDSPSDLRQLSYREAQPLIGPVEDPEGWKTLPIVTIHPQSIESQKPVKITCELSIANPSCYSRGTVIPCRLTLRSSDPVILDALSHSDAIDLTLQRRIKYHLKGMRGNKTTETSRLQSAVWWTPVNSSLPADAETRTLEGEIHLSRNLQSTSASPFFSVKYTIQFSALNSDAIHPESGIIKTPLTHTITIGTFAARGPRTREYSARS